MKAQVSTEFLILVSVLVTMFLSLYFGLVPLVKKAYYAKLEQDAKEVCRFVANEINLAYRVGDGYQRRFFIEERLLGFKSYDITVGNFFVYVEWDNKSVSCSVLTRSVNGNAHPGWNTIKNKKGDVYVE
ncbi:MAG: hypothetical protein J7K98_03285 [Candidatus Aenigmarchaeota archaeon]|nr:hypothetical protein [Candidatus Aenigmarchaeota archaeon]